MNDRRQFAFTGRVKRWKPERGFGFITRDDGRDVFVHASALREAGIAALHPGDRVRFDCVVDSVGRLRATRIALEQPRPAAAD